MNLSEQGRMFSGTTVIDDAGDSSDPSLNDDDLEYLHGDLSDSPLPLDVTGLKSDESYLGMAASDVSGADLLAALDSISFVDDCHQSQFEEKDVLGSDSYLLDSFGKRPDVGKGSSEYISAVSISEPSGERYGEAEVSGGIEEAQKLDNPVIVYTSSQRRSLRSDKSKRTNNSPNLSDIHMKIADSAESVGLGSLQISRRKRSLLGNRPRSFAWGTMANTLPDFEEHSGPHPSSSKGKKPSKKKSVQKKRTSVKDQDDKKPCHKGTASALPVIKIKLGNRSCTIGNVKDRKGTHESFDIKETKVGEALPGEEMVLKCTKQPEKFISTEASVSSHHLDVRDVPKNPSVNVSSYHHQVSSQVVGDDFVASSEHRCSDVGTSPDSEVINSVPEALEKISQNTQDTLTISNKACAPVGGVSSFSSPKTKSNNGNKKDKHNLPGLPSLEREVTGVETTDGVEELEGLGLIPSGSSKQNPKCSLAKGGSKNRSGNLDSLGKKEKASQTSQNKGNKDVFGGNSQLNGVAGTDSVVNGSENHLEAGCDTPSELGKSGDLSKDNSLQFISSGEINQFDEPGKAWVLCDECQKWRRIPAALADQIETTNSGWTCKDNMDKEFSDCSIPQEKSNSAINQELGISDEDAGDTVLIPDQSRFKGKKESTWSLIKSNLFLHRNRKKQTIDEVMVCHCKYPSDSRMGCGAKCLNRILNIECIKGTCPCGEFCSNQQFQKRKYAKLERFKCGKKGYGLQALEDISEGQFLIEYVGEVLDMHAYQARQKQYALNGHKHFYFMTLNGSEVIDACAKGNLGRFINHSCDPNCRTEKWMVNGEVCVGLFAVRDIKKGEEVTFDYNYVRVFGAAAKKCVCGSLSCQGYIGGDPTNSEIIVQSDSDEEYPEPVMICEDSEILSSFDTREKEIISEPLENRDAMKKPVSDLESIAGEHTFGTSSQKISLDSASVTGKVMLTGSADIFGLGGSADNVDRESLNVSTSHASCIAESEDIHTQMHPSSKLADISLQSVGSLSKSPSTDRHEISLAKQTLTNALEMGTVVSPCKSLPDKVEGKIKLKSAGVGGKDEAKSKSSSVKKGKIKSNVLKDKGPPAAYQLNTTSQKSKRPQSLNSQFEAVEEKLNDLLEPHGGISKRNDASRGYLKLLFLTAASGNDSHGEAVQSNRDLSMILDALLKTKSKTVLSDIIDKNGLQMLHNIMKQNNKHYRNTPILRKLLRVLEHLATRGFLTVEHIAGGPPRPGVESFKDSILTLTEHADKQVHQTARNFRDLWIPRHLRKRSGNGRDDGRIDSYRSQDHWSERGGKPLEMAVSSRIQTPASGTKHSSSLEQAASGSNNETAEKPRKRKSRWDTPPEESPHSKLKTALELDIDDDKPPGFSSPCNKPVVSTDRSSAVTNPEKSRSIKHPFDIVWGCLQPRFISRMPLTFGVPVSIVQQFSAAQDMKWIVGPGVPFYPFPPLPPYQKGDRPVKPTVKVDPCIDSLTGKKHTRTWNVDPEEKNVHTANDQLDVHRGGSHCMDRKYFKQQKLNHSKLAPPWVRMRNGWGHNGNNARSVQQGVSLGNGTNEFRNSYMEDGNWR